MLTASQLLGPEPIISGPAPVIGSVLPWVTSDRNYWGVNLSANEGVDVVLYAIVAVNAKGDYSLPIASNLWPQYFVLRYNGEQIINPTEGGLYKFIIAGAIVDKLPAGNYKIIVQGVTMNWQYNAAVKMTEQIGWDAPPFYWPGR